MFLLFFTSPIAYSLSAPLLLTGQAPVTVVSPIIFPSRMASIGNAGVQGLPHYSFLIHGPPGSNQC